MKKFSDFLAETHHSFDNIDYTTVMHPVKKGDTFRVFHGFRETADAVAVAKYGLSGKSKANRAYSYEFNNNPKGLFVTLNKKVAEEFCGSYGVQCIIEFNCTFIDLEAPVWPGNGYTVQGQMAQYFPNGREGRVARRLRRKEMEAEVTKEKNPNLTDAVLNSDDKYMAQLLQMSRENQALYIGDLNPKDIIAWHVREKSGGRDYIITTDPFVSIDPAEFLRRYGEKFASKEKEREVDDKAFAPDEPYDYDKFLTKIAERHGRGDKVAMEKTLGNLWADTKHSKRPVDMFTQTFDRYLWPKQMFHAMKDFHKRFKDAER